MQVKAFQTGTRAARARVTARQIRVRRRVLHSWACDAHRVRIFAARTLLVLILRTHFTDLARVFDEEMLRVARSADVGAVSGCRVLVCAVDAESATPRFDAVRINALAYIERAGIVRVQVVPVLTFQTELVTVPRTIRALRMLPILAAADAKRAYVRRGRGAPAEVVAGIAA